MPLGGHAAYLLQHCTGNPWRSNIYLPRDDRPNGRLDYKYCTNITFMYIFCDDYPTLANHEPVQLQGTLYMTLALNAFMVILMK